MSVDLMRICALRDGRTYAVDNDVLGIAEDLDKLSPTIAWRYPEAVEGTVKLKLRYSVSAEIFVVYAEYQLRNGKMCQELVNASPECDNRLYRRVVETADPNYDFAADMQKVDKEKQQEIDNRFDETMGELAQHLAHAVQKDMGIFFKTFVPRDIHGDVPPTTG